MRMNCGSRPEHYLGVDERAHARHRAEARLEPEVLAVRALARSADADPAGDVAGGDLGGADRGDRRAHAMAAMRGLVARIRVAAGRGGVSEAGAAAGIRGPGRADERGDDQRPGEQGERGVALHLPHVGYPIGVSYPPE